MCAFFYMELCGERIWYPAVVNIGVATSRLRDGQEVTVDGNRVCLDSQLIVGRAQTR